MAATSSLVEPMMCSLAAGVVSAAALHRRPIRGDTALALASIVFVVLYFWCFQSNSLLSALRASILLWSAFVLALAASTVAYRLSPSHPLARYPGPWIAKTSGLWLTGVSLGGYRYRVVDELHARYGPIVRIGPNILSINSPSARSLYLNAEKSDTYRRRLRSTGVELFLRPTVTKLHRERRRVWAGLFTIGSLSQLMPLLERRASELVQSLERRQCESPRGWIDLREAFSHWGFDFTADVVFGLNHGFELMKRGDPHEFAKTGKLAFAVTDALGASSWIMDILWRFPKSSRSVIMVSALERALHGALHTRPCCTSLASFLHTANVPEDEILRDVFIAMQGGSDNISVMLTLAVYFLLCQPHYYDRLRRELDEAFPDPTAPLSAETLAELPFLNGTISEALRLGTPFFLPRVVPPGGIVVDNAYIPEGTVVALAAYSQQISPENFFPDPMDFHPDRWVPDGLGPHTKADRCALASFTFGPYACIGKPLAYREMRHALARVVLTLDLALAPDFDAPAFREGMRNMHTTFFKHPLAVHVARRPCVKLDSLPGL